MVKATEEMGEGMTGVRFKGLFSSTTPDWATPSVLYSELDAEFHFDDDPCPLGSNGILTDDGLAKAWGQRVFVNPPYGRQIIRWTGKALEEVQRGKLIVMLLPCRTDTKWWHDHILRADEIRFIRGRLHFNDSEPSQSRAPFPSAIVIFRPKEQS